jgi:hypothetical protein
MDPLYKGILITLTGIIFFLLWARQIHIDDPEVRRKKFKKVLDEYVENLRKIDVEEGEIKRQISNFAHFRDIDRKNKQLRKAIKKYKW